MVLKITLITLGCIGLEILRRYLAKRKQKDGETNFN